MRYLSRPVSGVVEVVRSVEELAGCWGQLYPAVCEWVCAQNWDDGKPRVPATLLLLVDGDGVKVCLKDREGGRSLWRTAGTIPEALQVLEDTLAEGGVGWRRDTSNGQKYTGRK
jgi:hypothetical protein